MTSVKSVVKKVKSGFLKEMLRELVWIFRTASTYKGLIILFAILSLVTTVITMIISVRSKALVDAIVIADWDSIVEIATFYVILGFINVLLCIISQRFSSFVSCRVKKELSQKVYRSILAAKWEGMLSYHSGDFMSRMNEDVANISGCMVGWIPMLVTKGLQLVISVGLILYYDFSMLIVILIAVLVISLSSKAFLGKVFEANRHQRELSSQITSFEKESFQNLQTIKAFDLSDYFNGKLKGLTEEREKTDMSANFYSIASWAALYLSGQLAAIICLGWALYHVYTGVITLGTVAVMGLLAATIAPAFRSLIDIIPNAMATVASSERIREIFEFEPEEVIEEEKSRRFASEGAKYGVSVTVDHIDFSYHSNSSSKMVFRDASLYAKPGEIIALVGPSGEGKTTMLRILLGLIQTQAGNAFYSIGNDDSEHLAISQATRKLISYVPQGNTMMSGTIADNMRMFHPELTDEQIIDALKMACAWDFVEKLPDQLQHVIGESGIGFSEGQNQRLAIARALLCKAPVLLLDEASSALDIHTERKILHNIMKKDPHRTCILTTHRPSVLSLCDRVYRISDQKMNVIGDGEIRKLMDEF